MVDAWSTTCAPCLRDFPQLVALDQDFRKQGLRCVSFNCDYDGIPEKPPEHYRERVLRFLVKHEATFTNFQATTPLDVLLETGTISGLPSVAVYGRDGALLRTFPAVNVAAAGAEIGYDELQQLVSKLLNAP